MSVRNKFLLEPARAVLIVIDVQEKLCAAMEENALRQLTRNTGILLESALELAIPVIFTEQYVKGLGSTLGEPNKRRLPPPVMKKCHSAAAATKHSSNISRTAEEPRSLSAAWKPMSVYT